MTERQASGRAHFAVRFKVEEESAGTGRRVETHEYPNRDKPMFEDPGKSLFARPSLCHGGEMTVLTSADRLDWTR